MNRRSPADLAVSAASTRDPAAGLPAVASMRRLTESLEQSLHVALAHRHKVIADAHVVIAVLDSRHGPVARFIRLAGIDVSDVKSGLVVRVAGPHS